MFHRWNFLWYSADSAIASTALVSIGCSLSGKEAPFARCGRRVVHA
jgi:hypothetical protein